MEAIAKAIQAVYEKKGYQFFDNTVAYFLVLAAFNLLRNGWDGKMFFIAKNLFEKMRY